MFKAWILAFCIVSAPLYSQEVIFVGICGGTGSGKTTLAHKIQEILNEQVTLIEQDSYYKDLSGLHPEERDRANFDHPDALDFALLKQHLLALKNHESIMKPVYDFKTHTRHHGHIKVEPNRIIIVEGILLFAMPEIRELFDIKIFVDNQDDIRLLRRIERDIMERGRDFNSVKNQYMTTVKPMHDKYVEPSKWYADIIIPSVSENAVGIELITSRLAR